MLRTTHTDDWIRPMKPRTPARLRHRYEPPARAQFTKGSENVFADLGFAPAESKALLFRSNLMLHLTDIIARDALAHAQAA
jgi:hypothetical protein